MAKKGGSDNDDDDGNELWDERASDGVTRVRDGRQLWGKHRWRHHYRRWWQQRTNQPNHRQTQYKQQTHIPVEKDAMVKEEDSKEPARRGGRWIGIDVKWEMMWLCVVCCDKIERSEEDVWVQRQQLVWSAERY
jgi:hypothetical protein